MFHQFDAMQATNAEQRSNTQHQYAEVKEKVSKVGQ